MSFEFFLSKQHALHPSMSMQDMVKLCYQAAHGAEHLVTDKQKASKLLWEEFEAVAPLDLPLYEEISDNYVRINLSAWKFRGLDLKWLRNIFFVSLDMPRDIEENMDDCLNACRKMTGDIGWDEYIAEYKSKGMPPVHHSDVYREKEMPAYRVANKCFVRVFPILEALTNIKTEPYIIAIEGRAASGKTSLANYLSLVLEADICHMDDFFLPPALRTETRLGEIGGNIDYDRFNEEIVQRIRSKEGFSYRIFSCSRMNFFGSREIKSPHFRVVEGVYSLHPKFGNYADLCIFSDVDRDEQIERILKRDGVIFAERFKSTWIPMEEKYFSKFEIEEKCSIYIK